MSEEEMEADEFVAAAKRSSSFEGLVDVAMKELVRRFEEEPGKIASTYLMKIVLDGSKAIRAGDAPEEADNMPAPDVLELVSQEGLPTERKYDLLVAERLKAIERVTQIEKALEDLNG